MELTVRPDVLEEMRDTVVVMRERRRKEPGVTSSLRSNLKNTFSTEGKRFVDRTRVRGTVAMENEEKFKFSVLYSSEEVGFRGCGGDRRDSVAHIRVRGSHCGTELLFSLEVRLGS